MASIYNIPDWESSTEYGENDIVKHGGYYWYAIQASEDQTPAVGSAHWNGVITVALTTHSQSPVGTKPYFFWKPSYGVQVSSAPRVQSIMYGDGYEQRFKDGLFNNLLRMNFSVDSADEKEVTAISHFLDEKGAVKDFFYMPPPPHEILSKFICREWQTVLNFDNNYSISITLEQVP